MRAATMPTASAMGDLRLALSGVVMFRADGRNGYAWLGGK